VLGLCYGMLITPTGRVLRREVVRCVKGFPRALQRQKAAVVGERMKNDRHILARLDDLIEVADAAGAHSARQRSVKPDCFAALQKVAAGEVCCSEIVMAGYGVQRKAEPRRRRSAFFRTPSALSTARAI
jgi:hypothetical protein